MKKSPNLRPVATQPHTLPDGHIGGGNFLFHDFKKLFEKSAKPSCSPCFIKTAILFSSSRFIPFWYNVAFDL